MKFKEYEMPDGRKAVFEYDENGVGKITLECMDELMSMIADRPQGEWIEFDTKWGRSLYYCTNCMETSEVPTAFGKPLYDFCPNCGADMREREGE